jgi:hypothetical protein
MADRIFATHRQVTGPAYNHGYVYRRNKVVMACKHKHRTGDAAEQCAAKMLRKYLQSEGDAR